MGTEELLCSGEPICTLALAPHGLHTDINGDGVLEHVLAISDSAHSHKGHHLHDFMNPCTAYVYSGYPPKTPLFNGTVCSSASRAAMTSMLQQQRKGKGGTDGGQGECPSSSHAVIEHDTRQYCACILLRSALPCAHHVTCGYRSRLLANLCGFANKPASTLQQQGLKFLM